MSTDRIYAVGVGMTPFGRHADCDLKQLTRRAVAEALADAGLTTSAIEAVYFSNATQGHMEGQHMIRGEIALRSMGIGEIPVFNIENACASGSSAFQLAVTALKADDGGKLAERGDTCIGGVLPVNPSGGLESKGHPIGATGLGQIHELVMQLRGEAGARQVQGARVAVAENGGGLHGIEEAIACISILQRNHT